MFPEQSPTSEHPRIDKVLLELCYGLCKVCYPSIWVDKKGCNFVVKFTMLGGVLSTKTCIHFSPNVGKAKFLQGIYFRCWSVHKKSWCYIVLKDGKKECVITYTSKWLFTMQQKFHPKEGGSYALIWGVMHFQQFLHRNNFTLKIGHKSLEWLAIVLDAYGWKGRWINMLQDFTFKILHWLGSKHSNVDALN